MHEHCHQDRCSHDRQSGGHWQLCVAEKGGRHEEDRHDERNVPVTDEMLPGPQLLDDGTSESAALIDTVWKNRLPVARYGLLSCGDVVGHEKGRHDKVRQQHVLGLLT